MNIGLDWHGVMVNPDDLTISVAQGLYGVVLTPFECASSKAVQIMGGKYSEMVEFIESSGLMRYYPVAPGLKEAVGSWKAEGHVLYVVSSLNPAYIGSALDVLKGENILINGGWICSDNSQNSDNSQKHVIAKQMGLDLLIDDDPKIVRRALDFGVNAILFDRPCNRDADAALPRLYGWTDRKRYKL